MLLFLDLYLLMEPICSNKYITYICSNTKMIPIENNGLQPSELKLAEAIIVENAEIIVEKWNEYFNK